MIICMFQCYSLKSSQPCLLQQSPIIQSKVSQKEKHQYSILVHIYGIQKDGNNDPLLFLNQAKCPQQVSELVSFILGADSDSHLGWLADGLCLSEKSVAGECRLEPAAFLVIQQLKKFFFHLICYQPLFLTAKFFFFFLTLFFGIIH